MTSPAPELSPHITNLDRGNHIPTQAELTVAESIIGACQDEEYGFYNIDALVAFFMAKTGSNTHGHYLDQNPAVQAAINDILSSNIYRVPLEETYDKLGRPRQHRWCIDSETAQSVFFELVTVSHDTDGGLEFYLNDTPLLHAGAS